MSAVAAPKRSERVRTKSRKAQAAEDDRALATEEMAPLEEEEEEEEKEEEEDASSLEEEKEDASSLEAVEPASLGEEGVVPLEEEEKDVAPDAGEAPLKTPDKQARAALKRSADARHKQHQKDKSITASIFHQAGSSSRAKKAVESAASNDYKDLFVESRMPASKEELKTVVEALQWLQMPIGVVNTIKHRLDQKEDLEQGLWVGVVKKVESALAKLALAKPAKLALAKPAKAKSLKRKRGNACEPSETPATKKKEEEEARDDVLSFVDMNGWSSVRKPIGSNSRWYDCFRLYRKNGVLKACCLFPFCRKYTFHLGAPPLEAADLSNLKKHLSRSVDKVHLALATSMNSQSSAQVVQQLPSK
jgi:hypothetical protein